MKVLILTNHLNIGGVSTYTINLAHGLKVNGADVYVASGGGELEWKLKKDSIGHIRVNFRTKFEFNPKLLISFAKLFIFIRNNKIEIIHSQTRVTQVLGFLLSGATGAKYVSTCHGFFKSARLGRRVFGAWGNAAIAISDAVRDHLVKDFKLKEKDVFLIYNGVDTDLFSEKIEEAEKKALRKNLGFDKAPIAGSVCRLSPVKGLRYLLFAMKDVLAEMPEAQLLIVGEGPSKEYLMNLAKKLGIEGNVFFARSSTDTRRFLSIIDVFVFYSLEEGLGLSLLEAMAAGKPCVASSVGGVSSVIEHERTGLLIPPKDSHVLKEAIIRLFRDPELRMKLSEESQKLVRAKFSIETMIKKVMGVYDEVAKK